MKKYTTLALKRMVIPGSVCLLIPISGAVLMLFDLPNHLLPIVLVILGGWLSLLLIICYFAEKSRALIIGTDTLVFPRGATVNGRMTFRKTTVQIDEIGSVESELRKGDGIVAKDSRFLRLNLKDGTEIAVPLYPYGKEAEAEILQIIRNGTVRTHSGFPDA